MYFEEFNVGDVFSTRPRLITGMDVYLFAVITGVPNPIFFDDEAARNMGHQGRLAPGLLTLAMALGQQYPMGLLDHGRALLSIDGIRFKAPVRPGDAICCRIEVLHKNADSGIITFNWTCENQHGKTVLEAKAQIQMLKQPANQ